MEQEAGSREGKMQGALIWERKGQRQGGKGTESSKQGGK